MREKRSELGQFAVADVRVMLMLMQGQAESRAGCRIDDLAADHDKREMTKITAYCTRIYSGKSAVLSFTPLTRSMIQFVAQIG